MMHHIPLGSNGPAPFIVLKNVANILPILPQLMFGISSTLISRFYLKLHNPIHKNIIRQYIDLSICFYPPYYILILHSATKHMVYEIVALVREKFYLHEHF